MGSCCLTFVIGLDELYFYTHVLIYPHPHLSVLLEHNQMGMTLNPSVF